MMFRQIRILPEHADLQRILWSPSPDEPAQHYALQTVTYGEACAPYLSLRVLHQLCVDEGGGLPEAVDAVKNELYVDDFLSGADDVSSALRRRNQIVRILQAGGLVLKKWVANDPAVMEDIPPEDRLRPTWMQLATDGPVTELGIAWDPGDDRLRFTPLKKTPEDAKTPTKRRALAELAHVFDPAGWLAPLSVVAKMMIQDFWKAKLDWDEPLPAAEGARWASMRADLQDIGDLSIPRWIQTHPGSQLQLHAFSDASRRAMAAALYYRVTDHQSGKTSTGLLWAKTKLAPARTLIADRPLPRMTIPRLELRAALIAARLLRYVAQSLKVEASACYAWCDSQVVLHWLSKDEPVGNNLIDDYVAHVQELSAGVTWGYVPTDSNPADLATRGLDAAGLRDSTLWWRGPLWLQHTRDWPSSAPRPQCSEEEHQSTCKIQAAAVQVTPKTEDVASRFSDLGRLTRALARARRILKRRQDADTLAPLAPVSAAELRTEFLALVRTAQRMDFAPEINLIGRGLPVHRGSALRSLAPFLHDDGLIRVGGRLSNADIPFERRHPVIVSGSSHLAELIIRWAHLRSLHGGFRATYAYAIQRAWITNGRRRVRSHIHHCVTCAAVRARPADQVMAPLPSVRVTPAPAFSKSGLDYAGPFSILRSKGRGAKPTKGYVVVFVCLVTKAIHLELAGDLTTQSLLGALTRFTGRRGPATELHSDNGTNLRGADAELRSLLQAAELDWGLVEGQLAQQGIQWNFIPPGAPHFGGLWESAVKSTKAHLRRVAGPRNMTFEEFSTLLVDIERVLNSRPLVPMTGDPEDLDALTPAHLVIGRSLASIPEPSHADVNLNPLVHWELVKALRDKFWCGWSADYLNTLQQRTKWERPRDNVKAGELVVLLDPSLLKDNGRWPLARVIKVHPGSDGLVRAVTVKTAKGTYDRPIVKLARLPIHGSAMDPRLAKPARLEE